MPNDPQPPKPPTRGESVDQGNAILGAQQRESGLDLSTNNPQPPAPINPAVHSPAHQLPSDHPTGDRNPQSINPGQEETDFVDNIYDRVVSSGASGFGSQKVQSLNTEEKTAWSGEEQIADGDIEHPESLQQYNVPDQMQPELEDEFISPSVTNPPKSVNKKEEVQQVKPCLKVKYVRDSAANSVSTLPQRKLRPRKN